VSEQDGLEWLCEQWWNSICEYSFITGAMLGRKWSDLQECERGDVTEAYLKTE